MTMTETSVETQHRPEMRRPKSAPNSQSGLLARLDKTTLPALPVEESSTILAIPSMSKISASENSSPNSSHSNTPTNSVIRKSSGILTNSSSSINYRNTSTSSLPVLPNIQFAPLPILPIRKRRSTAPLGVAARGALMRKRRGEPEPIDNPALGKVEENGKGWSEHNNDEQEPDPFVTLGKMMKGMWRRVASKEQTHTQTRVVAGTTPTPVVVATRPLSNSPQRDNQGSVWEEEIGAEFKNSNGVPIEETESPEHETETEETTQDHQSIPPTHVPPPSSAETKVLPVYAVRARTASSSSTVG